MARRAQRTASAALLTAVVTVAGCAGGSAGPRASGAAQRVAAARQATLPAVTPADDQSCHPLESYRPSGPLPQPLHMTPGSTMDQIVKRGRLIAGVDQNSYLFGYRDPLTGQLDGFEIQLLKRISSALFGGPDRIQFKTITSARRVQVLTDHSVDIVVDSMTINCGRWSRVAFSSDYMDAGQRVLVPRSSTAKSIDDLGGKKVCAAGGTTSIQTLKDITRHPVIPVSVADWTDCLMLMQLGQVDAASTDDTILIGLQAQDPNTKLVGPRFTQEPHGIAMRKDQTDLVRFVNAVLEQMRQDGSLVALERRYLGSSADTFIPPPQASYRD